MTDKKILSITVNGKIFSIGDSLTGYERIMLITSIESNIDNVEANMADMLCFYIYTTKDRLYKTIFTTQAEIEYYLD